MWFFKKRRAKKKALELEKIEAEQKAQEAKKAKETVVPTKETTVKEANKPAPVEEKVTPKEKVLEAKEEEKEESKATAAKYHVSQNNDTKSQYHKQWRVRKGGSKKTIKYFKTQAEAIDYAEHLAEQAGSSIVIHKMDGKIRKQDYSKK